MIPYYSYGSLVADYEAWEAFSTLVIVVIAWILLQWFLTYLVTPLQNTSVACQTVFVIPFPDGCVRTRFVLLR